MTDPMPHLAMQNFFTGLAEQTFETRLGIVDPPLIDYLAGLLVRFISSDSLYHYRTLAGSRLDQVADMVVEAQARVGTARRELQRHIGDYTLFWTGVYPEALPVLQAPDRKDYFVSYCDEGKRAYRIASTIAEGEEDPLREVFARLAHEFDVCMQGLLEVRREWENQLPPGAGRVIVVT